VSAISLWVFLNRQRKHKFPCVFTNFPVCFYKTDKKIWIFLCVHEFSCEYLPNRQRKSLFPCLFIIFSGSFHTTDRPEWIFLCVWLFPVSLSVTDKETWISLWVAEKTRREIRHTQRKNSFQWWIFLNIVTRFCVSSSAVWKCLRYVLTFRDEFASARIYQVEERLYLLASFNFSYQLSWLYVYECSSWQLAITCMLGLRIACRK